MILAILLSAIFLVSCKSNTVTPVLEVPVSVNSSVNNEEEDLTQLKILSVNHEDSLKTESLLSKNQNYINGIYNYFHEIHSDIRADGYENLKLNSVSFYEVIEKEESKSFVIKFSKKLSDQKVNIIRIDEYLNIENPITARLVLLSLDENTYKLSLNNMKLGIYLLQLNGLTTDKLNDSGKVLLPKSFKLKMNYSRPIYVCEGAKLKLTKDSYYLTPTAVDREFPVKEFREFGNRQETRLATIGNMVNRSRGDDSRRTATPTDLLKFIKVDNSVNTGFGLRLYENGGEIIFKSNDDSHKCDFVKIETLKSINHQSMRIGTMTYMGNPINVGETRNMQFFEVSRFIDVFDRLEVSGDFQIY